MKNILAAIITTWLATGAASAQTVVLAQDVNQDTIESNWGQNRKHYLHPYVGFGLATETEFNNNQNNYIKYGLKSGGLLVGFRYKLRLAEHYAVGFDLGYNRQALNFRQQEGKTFPTDDVHEREKLIFNNFALEFYNRFNFGKRGNHLGKFVDVGAFGEWTFGNSLLVEDKIEDPATANGARWVRSKFKDLNYINKLNYGVSARIGYGRWSLFGRYRLSDIIDKQKTGNNDLILPRLTTGLQIKI